MMAKETHKIIDLWGSSWTFFKHIPLIQQGVIVLEITQFYGI